MQEVWQMCSNMMMGWGGMLMMGGMILTSLLVLALAFLGLRWLWQRSSNLSR